MWIITRTKYAVLNITVYMYTLYIVVFCSHIFIFLIYNIIYNLIYMIFNLIFSLCEDYKLFYFCDIRYVHCFLYIQQNHNNYCLKS